MIKNHHFLQIFAKFSLFSILFFASCKQGETPESTDLPPEASSYIYAYTSGIISRSSDIKVHFTQPAVEEALSGHEEERPLLYLSDKVPGKLYWESTTSLVFSPEEPLQPGKSYTATLNLGKLFPDAPRSVRKIHFAFRTRDLKLSVQPLGLQTPDPQNLSKQQWRGILHTSDEVSNENIEKCLQAQQNGQSLSVSWQHHAPEKHEFTVQNIVRTEKAAQVQISWHGKPVQSEDQGSLTVEVPPLGQFSLTHTRAEYDPRQRLVLEFSDPLLTKQNLNGLISLQSADGKKTVAFNTDIESNLLYIYPATTLTGEWKIHIAPGLKNTAGKKLPVAETAVIQLEDQKPRLRISGTGTIVPDSRGLILPFEVIGLHAVELEVFKIYHNNILQFLQTNQLNESSELYRVGKIILRKKIDLNTQDGQPLKNGWTRYAIDLQTLIQEEPGAIYQVRLGFFPGYTNLSCDFENNPQISYTEPGEEQRKNEKGQYLSFMENWYGVYGYYSGYWKKQEDPCEAAYYNQEHFASRNLLASNIGLIAKKGNDGSLFCVATDLRSAQALSGVEISLYNYQQQHLAKAQTDNQGFASFNDPQIVNEAFFAIATHNGQHSYLRLQDYESLSLSRFDIAGVQPQHGMKGYFYAERDVWRPGDSIYLHFVLQSSEEQELPQSLPITFELYDARGQLREKRVSTENYSGIYPLHCKTESSDPTGQWTAKVTAGGARFRKTLLVETIKPNRLKVQLDFGKKQLSSRDEPHTAKISARWLHGAPAQGLRAVVEMQLSSNKTTFSKFSGFVFDDPLRKVADFTPAITIFDSYLDENGQASFSRQLVSQKEQAGMLRLRFKTRVFEKGGDFSTNIQTFHYAPYEQYAGVLLPTNEYGEKRLDTGKEKTLIFAAVDANGRAQSKQQLQVEIYRVQWRWWWDTERESLAEYINGTEVKPLISKILTTDQQGQATWSVQVDEWGRYLVRVCHVESGHCAGDFFYAGYPWYDEDGMANVSGANMLSISTNKEVVQTGEEITINIPAAANSRLLLSLENGKGVLQARWYELQAGNNTIQFKATPEMSPTIYAFATLIQPHAQTENDLPMRMYGVVPIRIEDPQSHLKPQIATAEEYKPNSKAKITVSEANGRPMAYTLAIVDEGLLDLTNFQTPNPHDGFYAKEGLGVQTFDLYDYVLGAYGGKISRLLSVGGDGAVAPRPEGDKSANRFKPVVIHLGPFHLKKGQKATHEIKLPNYIGSVRVMLVAASTEKAYGRAEKTVPVRKELMVLATLPRVLGPGESLMLPVHVFAMKQGLHTINISLQTDGQLIKANGNKKQKISFSSTGEKTVYFPIETAEATGTGKILVTAQSNGFESTQQIEIQVRNPNPYLQKTWEHNIEGKGNWQQTYTPIGIQGTNEIVLEASVLPAINLQSRLNELIHYPYGCLEQTLSGGFPQLYLPDIMALDKTQKKEINDNIRETLQRLKNFQQSNGSFTYWPGQSYLNPWSDLYAGHFLLEAKNKGYHVPFGMLDRWLKHQKKLARNWDPRQNEFGFYRYQSDLEQAYRLYLLSLAQKPEMGAMNRLRNSQGLSANARWRLAAAYAITGKTRAANQLVNQLNTQADDYRELSGTFGSSLRDEALMLETLTLLGKRDQAADLLKRIAQRLNSDEWWSTQSIAFALISIGKFIGEIPPENQVRFQYQLANGSKEKISSDKPLTIIRLPANENTLHVQNLGEGMLFLRIIATGQPATGRETARAENLQLHVQYTDMQGKPLSPASLSQGTDFLAKVTVSHPGPMAPFREYRELALQQIFPSGWEIVNTRLEQMNYRQESPYTYRDIRDDRVYTFFNLGYQDKVTYIVQLTAAYQGRYYLPATQCAAMYDNSIAANNKGMWVEVTAR